MQSCGRLGAGGVAGAHVVGDEGSAQRAAAAVAGEHAAVSVLHMFDGGGIDDDDDALGRVVGLVDVARVSLDTELRRDGTEVHRGF